MSAAEIATNLSPLQREAMLWLPANGASVQVPQRILNSRRLWHVLMSLGASDQPLVLAVVFGLTKDRHENIRIRATRFGHQVRRALTAHPAAEQEPPHAR
ncbi:hypothetical protein [Roseomonas chloroacetimidivorans]|uniref:hypothetical protein n=1 Tax=Roseomonas chloroacetimidivorans TaxID=1766656 RepID=UPI003C790C13